MTDVMEFPEEDLGMNLGIVRIPPEGGEPPRGDCLHWPFVSYPFFTPGFTHPPSVGSGTPQYTRTSLIRIHNHTIRILRN